MTGEQKARKVAEEKALDVINKNCANLGGYAAAEPKGLASAITTALLQFAQEQESGEQFQMAKGGWTKLFTQKIDSVLKMAAEYFENEEAKCGHPVPFCEDQSISARGYIEHARKLLSDSQEESEVVRELAAALEPFALDPKGVFDGTTVTNLWGNDDKWHQIRASHLRKAAALIAKHSRKGPNQ